ncbi:MAG: ribosome maturation factor RimP [Clostridia bacterium]|nr:ribosome maturation factor RimP [Clostridia bacterium]
MANKVEETAFSIGDKIAEEKGLYLVHAEYKKESGDYYLRLFIDKEGGVGIDDCEDFSRTFSDIFDKDDPTDNAYILEVSSPGADRKLVTDREFLYYIGREVDVKLYAARDGKKEISGILMGYENGTARIKTEDSEVEIPKKDAVYIRLSFKF